MRRTFAVLVAAAVGGLLLGPVTPPSEATSLGRDGVYRFIGGGWGHSVGASQYGMRGMADAGHGAGAILAHYYRGTSLANRTQPQLRVWLADVGSEVAFTTSGPIAVTSDEPAAGPVQVDTTPSSAAPVRVVVEDGGISLAQGPNRLLGPVAGPIAIRPEASPQSLCGGVAGSGPCITLNATGHRYRWGVVEVARVGTSATLRVVVRELPMERYLYGLGEMPSSWHMEALKAQAIAGRTYGLEKVLRLGQNRPGCSCGLLRTTSDQNYVGFEKEAEGVAARWRQAVDETATVIVTHGGNPIQAMYTSSSGGWTENNEHVFGGSPLPYLRGVHDPGDDAASPHRWTREYTGAELESWLNADAATSIGTLHAVQLAGPYGVSGIPGAIHIHGSSGTKTVTNGTFRRVVNAGAGSSRQLMAGMFQLGYLPYGRAFRGGIFVSGSRTGPPVIAFGAGEGGGPHVVVQNRNGQNLGSFFAFGAGFLGGVRVSVCDVTGDDTPEIVVGAGPGGGPHVRIFSLDGSLVSNGFFAFGPGFTGGIYVGCSNVDGAGKSEIVVGAGAGGGPHVRVFRASGELVDEWFAYDAGFSGGVRVAGGDVVAGGPQEVVTGAGPGSSPLVRVVADIGTQSRRIVSEFDAFASAFRGGVYVGVAAGSPADAIILGAGEGGGPHLRARRSDSGHLLDAFVFGGPMANGVRVGSVGGAVLASTGPGTWPIARYVP